MYLPIPSPTSLQAMIAVYRPTVEGQHTRTWRDLPAVSRQPGRLFLYLGAFAVGVEWQPRIRYATSRRRP